MKHPKIDCAEELEVEAAHVLRRADQLVDDAARMKRKARRLREEVAAEQDAARAEEFVGSEVRVRRA